MFNRKNVIIALGLLAVLAAAFWLFFPRPNGDASAQTSARTATVERGTIEVRVDGTGQIEPASLVTLSFSVSGNVGEVNVEVGDEVEQGDVLLALDPNTLDNSLLSAEAELIQARQQLDNLVDPANVRLQLAEARKELASARDALDDAEYLHRVRQEGNRASKETIEAAEASLVIAEHQVDLAKAAYDQLSGRDDDDPAKALARQELAGARQERDAALRSLNWYTGKPTELEQAQLEADVALAEARVADAQERVDTLEQGPDPQEVALAQARVRAAESRVEQFRLTAPYSGRVLAVYYQVGDSVTPGQPAVVVADMSQMHVVTGIDELDVASIETGQPVELTLDALPDVTLSGEVAHIDLAPASGSGTTEYPVQVDITSMDERARVGMTAAVSILAERKQDAVLIPNWTLRFDPTTNEVFVMVQTAEGPTRRDIRLGLRNDSVSEVVEGLTPGEVIVGTIATEESGGFPGPFGGGD